MGEHHDDCPFWAHFARAQVERLRRCIDENKWYLSQKAGHDVGPHVAEADFIRNHADRVAAEFRVDFCQRRCTGRELCRLAALVDDLNRFWDDINHGAKSPLTPPPTALSAAGCRAAS